MPLSHAEFMTYSATRIQAVTDGLVTSRGTGFFFEYRPDTERSAILLLTNKHVIQGCHGFSIVLHLGETIEGEFRATGRFVERMVDLAATTVIEHPTADLCGIVISPLIQSLQDSGTPPYIVVTKAEHVPTDDHWAQMDAIEPVTMVGCPNGLFDDFNGLPIMRSGSTASHPGRRFQGQAEFLIDVACFPGSSGSPVYLYNNGSRWDRTMGEYSLGNVSMHLLGILRAGPIIDARGRIVLNQQPNVIVQTMMHLGQVIRSSAIFELQDQLIRLIANERPTG